MVFIWIGWGLVTSITATLTTENIPALFLLPLMPSSLIPAMIGIINVWIRVSNNLIKSGWTETAIRKPKVSSTGRSNGTEKFRMVIPGWKFSCLLLVWYRDKVADKYLRSLPGAHWGNLRDPNDPTRQIRKNSFRSISSLEGNFFCCKWNFWDQLR